MKRRAASARVLALLLLFLAAVGVGAQSSYFSSFFSRDGKSEGGAETAEANVAESGEAGETEPSPAYADEEDEIYAMMKMQALMDDAASFGLDVDEEDEFEAYLDDEDFHLAQATEATDAGEARAPDLAPDPAPDPEPHQDPDPVPDDQVHDDPPAPAPAPVAETEDEERADDAEEDAEEDEEDEEVDDAAALEAMEARLAELEAEREAAEAAERAASAASAPAAAPLDDIEEEDLPAGGDGEEAPTVRAPRTLLTARDDDDDAAAAAAAATTAKARLESTATQRRGLLAMSVSGDNTRWVGFEDMPQRLREQRSGPEVRVARSHGNAHVTRPGGYWQAARFNKVERPSRSKLPKNFGRGSGEGTLSGPRGGINQHDRVGINKASGWPGRLHSNQVSTDPYPGLASRDNVGLSIQPYVKGVTSYSPNRRLQNYQYRNAAQVSYLKCLYGADEFRCEDANVFTVGPHAFKVGDVVLFSGVLGADRAKINGVPFVVAEVPADGLSFKTSAAAEHSPSHKIDTATGSPEYDVSSAYVTRQKTPTTVNPNPLVGSRDWSYEDGDKIYFFVTMSEPVVVTGSPTLRLNTGAHFEKGAEHAVATFLGGGYGEKKTFWKNNERNPMKNPMEANKWYEDLYHVHDGGCTEGLAADSSADCVTLSDNGVCDCAHYSGVTKTTASAELRTRRTHTFQPGDLVIVQGVTGPDASLLNKQHTVGAVRASGSGAVSRTDAGVSRGDGNDIITFYPPLDLRGRSFDASQAVVGRANIGNECRAGAGKDGTKHGAAYCLFSADTRYHLPTTDSTLLDHTRYGQQLPGQPGHLGIGNTGRGATMGSYADEGGPVVTTRKEFQYNEERSEQYMDNVLAFEFTVEGGTYASDGVDAYVQSAANAGEVSANETHLTSDLEYLGTDALELDADGGSIKRACANVFQVKAIECGAETIVTVYGKHRMLPGDVVALEGIQSTDASARRAFNRDHRVAALEVSLSLTSENRVDWDKIWDAAPQYDDASVSKFKIDLDSATLCASAPTVTREGSRARRRRAQPGDGSTCKFVDARLKLPKPGDKMRGTRGYLQSLSYNKDITVGRAYVTNVTTDAPAGTYGYNDGFGVREGSVFNFGNPDVVDVKVSFSEPVLASCGEHDDAWTSPEQYPGIRFRVCESIRLVLATKDGSLPSTANHDSTTGGFGEAEFPTGFLYETGYDGPNVLNFRYLPRRGDNTTALQYKDEFALRVECAVENEGGACVDRSHVRRTSDNKLAGVRLPPTKRDAGRCVDPAMCESTTADHRYSLAGFRTIKVNAVF